MDLLKDITDGLRGDDDHARQDDESAATGETGDDSSDPVGPAERSDEPADHDDSRGDVSAGSDDATGERGRDDEHVCSFCRTAFDAARRSCPECDAEVVLRGGR